MRVVTRIQLSALPVLLGLVTVALLAYFGEYHRETPALLVVTVAVAVAMSSLVGWHNARILVRRVRALGTGFRDLGLTTPSLAAGGDEFDELDAIRLSVRQLADAQESLRTSSAERVARAEARLSAQDDLLRQLSATVQVRLEEARLALHILQTSPFGELNENQEELIAAARTAAESASDELRVLSRLAEVSTAGPAALEPCTVRTLVEVPLIMAFGGAADVAARTTISLPVDLPAVLTSLPAAHEALATYVQVAARALEPGDRLTVDAVASVHTVVITLEPFPAWTKPPALREALARRVLEAQGVTVSSEAGVLRLHVPVADLVGTRRPTP